MIVSKRERRLRQREFQMMVNICLETIREKYGNSVRVIAEVSHLSTATIYRLQAGQVSVFTHAGTLQVLAEAAGYNLEMNPTTIRMRRESQAS